MKSAKAARLSADVVGSSTTPISRVQGSSSTTTIGRLEGMQLTLCDHSEGWASRRSTPVFDGLWAPARNAGELLRGAVPTCRLESVNTALTRGHGARAVDRDCGSVSG